MIEQTGQPKPVSQTETSKKGRLSRREILKLGGRVLVGAMLSILLDKSQTLCLDLTTKLCL